MFLVDSLLIVVVGVVVGDVDAVVVAVVFVSVVFVVTVGPAGSFRFVVVVPS